MIERELVVKDEVGLHARPASLFVKLAQEFNGTVVVRFPKVNKETGEEEVVEKDGKSMIGILSLGIAKDKPFTLVLDGDDEESFLIRFEPINPAPPITNIFLVVSIYIPRIDLFFYICNVIFESICDNNIT